LCVSFISRFGSAPGWVCGIVGTGTWLHARFLPEVPFFLFSDHGLRAGATHGAPILVTHAGKAVRGFSQPAATEINKQRNSGQHDKCQKKVEEKNMR